MLQGGGGGRGVLSFFFMAAFHLFESCYHVLPESPFWQIKPT